MSLTVDVPFVLFVQVKFYKPYDKFTMIKYKSVAVQYKALGTDDGIVEAYVSVFGNVDSYGDRVEMGAFTKSLAIKMPKLVWQHEINKPVGKTLEAKEIGAGDASLPEEIREYGALWVKGAFNLNTIDGRDAYEHIKFGSVDEYSFGSEEVVVVPLEDGTKSLKELRIIEWSPVTLGANPLTLTASVKSLGIDPKADMILEAMASFMDHMTKHADMKEKSGAAISRVRRERLRSLADAAKEFHKELIKMLDETERPEPLEEGKDSKAILALLSFKFNTMEIN